MAGACEGFSGADLGALLADAQLEAVHEVLADPGGADKVGRWVHDGWERTPGCSSATLASFSPASPHRASNALPRLLYLLALLHEGF